MKILRFISSGIVSALVLATVSPNPSFACRELVKFADHLPQAALEGRGDYFVVRIDSVSGETYSGTLVDPLEPEQRAGDQVTIRFRSGEEAHAVCPIKLATGHIYLLRSATAAPSLTISRFNGYDVEKGHRKFDTYVQDVKDARKRG